MLVCPLVPSLDGVGVVSVLVQAPHRDPDALDRAAVAAVTPGVVHGSRGVTVLGCWFRPGTDPGPPIALCLLWDREGQRLGWRLTQSLRRPSLNLWWYLDGCHSERRWTLSDLCRYLTGGQPVGGMPHDTDDLG